MDRSCKVLILITSLILIYSLSNNATPSRPSPKPQNNKTSKCPVCEEFLPTQALLFHVAQHHFPQLLAASRVPTVAPFKCPLCPHYSEDYGSILRHFLVFHNQMDLLTERLKNPDLPVVEPKVGLLKIDTIF